MVDPIRRFRGTAIALVVLAVSAGAVFAAAPGTTPVSATHPVSEQPTTGSDEDATETPKAAETPDATDTPDATETADATETPDAPDAADAAPTADTHGDLVSTAAQMPTPALFRNHGAFVSCVAKMDKGIVVSTFDWTTVTPASCGQTADGGATGKTHAQAGKAKGEAARTKPLGKSHPSR